MRNRFWHIRFGMRKMAVLIMSMSLVMVVMLAILVMMMVMIVIVRVLAVMNMVMIMLVVMMISVVVMMMIVTKVTLTANIDLLVFMMASMDRNQTLMIFLANRDSIFMLPTAIMLMFVMMMRVFTRVGVLV